MKRMTGAAILREGKNKSTRWLAATMVCACEACCVLEPWRRRVRKYNLRKLRGSTAMSGARW